MSINVWFSIRSGSIFGFSKMVVFLIMVFWLVVCVNVWLFMLFYCGNDVVVFLVVGVGNGGVKDGR
jgi:hypothetical protein